MKFLSFRAVTGPLVKYSILVCVSLGVMMAHDARGTLYTETFTVGAAIPDGNPIGATFLGNVSDAPSGATVGGLTVGLNISGGYNGDLYAYLVAPNGTMVILLNQAGVGVNQFGASGAGMNITLQDGIVANGNIQNETSSSLLAGTYNAAGSLSEFNGSTVDGIWTLYFADLSSGGGTSTLNNWTLSITAVPEPVESALCIFALVLTSVWGARRWVSRQCNYR